MAESTTPAGEPGAATAGYTPPSGRGKFIAMIVAVLIVTNLVTGLAVFYLAQPPAAAGPTVSVIGPWAGTERAAFLPVLDLFSRTTNISYTFSTVRQEDLQSTLPTNFAAQQAPADLIFMPSSFVKQYGMEGHARNLAGVVPESNYASGTLLDPVRDGNNLWGATYTGKVKPGFWYRQSFFDANGLTVPTSFTEFEQLLLDIETVSGIQEAIISGDGVGWPLSDATEHFIATYGGPTMHRQLMSGTLAWTDASVRTVFADRLVPTLSAGRWSEPVQWDTGVQSWWDGDYGLYFMGSWITGMVSDPTDLGVFSLPEAPGEEGIVFATDFFFVPTYAQNMASALELAEFLSTATAQTMQVRQGGHVATSANVPLTAYPAVDANVARLLTDKDVLLDLDDTIGGTFQTTFWSELQSLWADPASLDTVLANIESAAP